MDEEEVVQTYGAGNGYPVPAALWSEQVGSQSSITSNRNTTVVANLAAVVDIETRADTPVGNLAVVPDNASRTKENNIGANDEAFKKSSILKRSPVKNITWGAGQLSQSLTSLAPRTIPNSGPLLMRPSILNIENASTTSLSSDDKTMINGSNEITMVMDQAKGNYYEEWKKEVAARKHLEQALISLQQHVQALEENMLLHTTFLTPVPKVTLNPVYCTDEEELARETDWILEKRKRRSKKRKANESPESATEEKELTPILKQTSATAVKATAKTDTNKKIHIPPPIIVSSVETFGEIKNITKSIESIEKECKVTSYNNNAWKINVSDSESYRLITDELSQKRVQWHSYENKDSRPIKVMARGLHPSCDENEIIQDLTEKNFQITSAKNIIKKVKLEKDNGGYDIHKRGLPLFMLTFANNENIEKIFNIKSIMSLIVKIEPLRKNSNQIPQCKRCQAFGHTQRYCNRNFACVKCTGKHSTKNCTILKDQKARCVNCRGDHPANYRGCPIAKEQQERKNKQTNNQRPKQSVNVGTRIPTSNSNNQTETPKKSYADIVRNRRQEEDISIKGMLSTILQRLNDQEKLIKTVSEEVAKIKGRTAKLSNK